MKISLHKEKKGLIGYHSSISTVTTPLLNSFIIFFCTWLPHGTQMEVTVVVVVAIRTAGLAFTGQSVVRTAGSPLQLAVVIQLLQRQTPRISALLIRSVRITTAYKHGLLYHMPPQLLSACVCVSVCVG